ncbi:pitrilysin family protein [Bernardetia sp. Wsw4-3y2]|uniref:M16 family metallopeptidase n=1 Tax=Bernardetia sp. Wsw4-3y2 TaxID=3127471 RepID=UPI0030D02EC9
MIDFSHFTLDNGLRVFIHQDKTVAIATVNIMYDVGSRDESPERTGFAHLFEHLMFSGSANIPNFDTIVQQVGGSNNAYTSPDVTNYYTIVPAPNVETALWLEADRMLSLSINDNSLEVQRKVVIEEFKQRYLNQPYGDIWLHLRPLVYQKHSYNWATIGKEIKHIEDATLEEVKAFFYKHYRPDNAVLVVAGNVEKDEVEKMVKKWFGDIPKGNRPMRNLENEPPQTEARHKKVEAKVPLNAIYKAYRMGHRKANDYYATDLVSDVLGRDKSARLYQELVKEKEMFNSIGAYIMGSVDEGLLVISGKLNPAYSPEQGEEAIQTVIDDFLENGISDDELTKVKNQAEASHIFSEIEVLNRAMNIAYYAILGDVEMVNTIAEQMAKVTKEELMQTAKKTLRKENCSTLLYYSKELNTVTN